MMRVLNFMVALTLLAAPVSAWAQEASEAGIIYKKKTVVSFGDDTIDGDLTKPDGAYVESRKRVRHSNLIKIRDNFRDRVLGSVSKI
ncbi:MAG: adventurous gliding motility protein CglF [Deltaproteobacteria bacterium]